MPDVIQTLWIGPRLSTMERLSIRSFLRHGHEVHLYTYGEVEGIPPGTIIRDGREILPAERIFVYREHDSVSGFSNFFRYKLLLERGGWWVDTDMICLRPFAFDTAHVFGSEWAKGGVHVNSGAIKAPAGSEAMAYAWDVCNAKDPASLRWGETGPRLMVQVVERFGLQAAVQQPEVFCPISFPDWRRVLDPDPPSLPPESVAIHLWNEMWRRNGADKDAQYDERSLWEQLKRSC
ncbi:MAG TPA: glycosyltransferase [Thermoanaerobaculia bacterium]|nr:glycosyltransferase [Thermoanaerobaculia bacterium]